METLENFKIDQQQQQQQQFKPQQAFASRAKHLKTPNQTQKQREFKQKKLATTQGLSKEEFWNSRVRSKEDVKTYFAMYHPEYPELLVDAIATRFERLIDKAHSTGKLSEQEMVYLKKDKPKEKMYWNPEDEIEQQKLEAKINLATKRMDELLNE